MKICPKCNKEFPDDVNFCKYDGTKLAEKNAKTESEKKCPKCGTPAVNGAKFCNMCGSPLTAETKKQQKQKNSRKRKTAPKTKSSSKKEISLENIEGDMEDALEAARFFGKIFGKENWEKEWTTDYDTEPVTKNEINKSGDVESLFNLDFIEIPELHIKMLRTPVTKEMFKSVTEELRRAFEPDTFYSVFPLYKAEWIAEFDSGFSRYDAERFCLALSRLSKSPRGKMLFRLPTNDEFDYVLSHKIPIHYDLKKEWTQDCKEQSFYYYRDFRYKKGQKDWAHDVASSDFVFRLVRSM